MIIQKLTERDRDCLYRMMRPFYDSPALIHKSSDRVLLKDIEDCLSDSCPFLEGYLFWEEGQAIGYTMITKCYTTEYGGICIWVEDLYFEPEHRAKGHAAEVFAFIEKTYPEAVRFKLEVEQENEYAIAAYKKSGYQICGYFEMTKENDPDTD